MQQDCFGYRSRYALQKLNMAASKSEQELRQLARRHVFQVQNFANADIFNAFSVEFTYIFVYSV